MTHTNHLLIRNADYIITMDAAERVLQHADILIEGNRIVQLGQNLPLPPQTREYSAAGRIVIPGMVNVHQHCSHTIVRNLPHTFEGGLMDTLKLFYAGLAYFDEGSVRAAAFGSLADLLKTGCTTTCDMHYVFPAAAKNAIDWELETAAQLGIRMHVLRGSLTTSAAEGCWHVPQSLVESPDTIARDCVRVIERYHDRSFGAMTRVGIAPCWLLYEDPTALRVCQELSEAYHVPLHSHLADSRDEFTYAKERYGCTPVEYADRIGYLQPGNFYAHCIQLTKSDFAKLAKNGVGIACCSNSDLILNTGVTKVPECWRRGIRVGIGVDGAASDNASNMIGELKSTYLCQRFFGKETSLTPQRILRLATVGGAEVLGRTDIGYLAPGMMADLVLLDWDQIQYAGGKYDPVYAAVLSGDARMVDTVFVNGRMVVERRHLKTADEAQVNTYINQQTARMVARWQGA